LAAHLFAGFLNDCIENEADDPMSILLDQNFLAHDLYSCLHTLAKILERFFDIHSIAGGFSQSLAQHAAGMRADLSQAAPLYRDFFAGHCASEQDLLLLWTALFAGGLCLDSYHFLAGKIVATGKLAESKLPLFEWIQQRRKPTSRTAFSPFFESIIALLEGNPDAQERSVGKFQVRQLALCMRQQAEAAEIIHIETLLKAALGPLK
jgi:hypothetical protein